MLLAVIGLAEAGGLKENKIKFLPPLLDRYIKIFEIVRDSSSHPNPYFPFFHLKSDKFWHLRALAGRESVLENMDSARSYSKITANIEHAYLDTDLFSLLQVPESRSILKAHLIARWFYEFRNKIESLSSENAYEKKLRDAVELGVAEEPNVLYKKTARSVVFRRIVIEAYDYRCAASGKRIILTNDIVMVEAAHLIPFSKNQNDDPRNGMALTPDFHWALDKNIIAPGPDYKWHVSKHIDNRIADNKPLSDLNGRKVILPKDKRYWPDKVSLEERFDMMKSGER